jgi:hypothetical protein
MDYWESIISDSFSETISNIFYLAFLLKLKLFYLWDSPSFDALMLVPDYEQIENSKFGRTDNVTGRRNKKRAKYSCNKLLRETTEKWLKEARQDNAKLADKMKRAKYAESEGPGGNQAVSRCGSVSLTYVS